MKILIALITLFFSFASYSMMAPRFKGELIDGTRTKLSDHMEEDKALLICFWATWCVPCLEELNHIRAGIKGAPNLPLKVLTVNVDTSDTTSDIKPTIKLYKLPFPVILDPNHAIFSKYHKETTLPFSVLVSPKGKVLKVFKGADDGMFDEIKKNVKVALGKTK